MKNWIRYIFLLQIAPILANTAFVGGGTNLAVVDTGNNAVTHTIPLGSNPSLIAITPNNLFAYVTELNDSRVAVIDTATNAVSTIINIPSGSPLGIAITPNGRFAYVTNQLNNTVSVISIPSNTVVDTISGFALPWGIAIVPSGKFAYVVNLVDGFNPGSVTVIDLDSNTLLSPTIPVGIGPTAIAATPDGKYLYVTNENENTVSVISSATNQNVATISVGLNPFEITASPKYPFVYVSNNAYTDIAQSSVSVISTLTNQVVATIPLYSSGPAGLAVTPDGETLYVTNTLNIAVISTATNQVIDTIALDHMSSIAITGTLIADLKGQQRCDDFAACYEFFNHLQWLPTPYSDVIGYNVYRNGKRIASLNGKTWHYNDHNQPRNVPVLYAVAPIEASGKESNPLSVVVK